MPTGMLLYNAIYTLYNTYTIIQLIFLYNTCTNIHLILFYNKCGYRTILLLKYDSQGLIYKV